MKYHSEHLIEKLFDTCQENRRWDFSVSQPYFNFAFLCGKGRPEGDKKEDNRGSIQKSIIEKHGGFAIYSEDLFAIFSNFGLDLLTIEQIIMSVSTSLIILVESFGSACELGAFSVAGEDISKTWVIADVDHKDDNSFIEKGPLAKIKSVCPGHVIYEKFSEEGIIVFSSSLVHTLEGAYRTTFKKSAVKLIDDGNTIEICDLSFIACLIFDYIRLFGCLLAADTAEVLRVLLCKGSQKTTKKITFSLSLFDDDGVIISPDTVDKVLSAIPEVLRSVGLLVKRENRGNQYYSLNLDFLKEKGRDLKNIPSMIFLSSFSLTSDFVKQLCIIKNTESKEGFMLW